MVVVDVDVEFEVKLEWAVVVEGDGRSEGGWEAEVCIIDWTLMAGTFAIKAGGDAGGRLEGVGFEGCVEGGFCKSVEIAITDEWAV